MRQVLSEHHNSPRHSQRDFESLLRSGDIACPDDEEQHVRILRLSTTLFQMSQLTSSKPMARATFWSTSLLGPTMISFGSC